MDCCQSLFADTRSLAAGYLLFPFPKPKNQIHNKSNKRHRGNNPPLGLFTRCAEILLGHVDDGPDGGNKKGNTECQKYAE